jgi:diguanylate cyclase (GGDEF)-like protein
VTDGIGMSLLARAPSHVDEGSLAYQDPLTDLPSQVRLAERLSVSLARAAADGASVVLLSIDLDGLTAVIDGFGDDARGELLCQVARRLDTIRRPTDLLVRHGDTEFGLLAELESGVEPTVVVSAIAERIRSVLEAPFMLADAEVCIAASVGAAIYPADALNARELQRHADSAMDKAKHTGGRFALYDSDTVAPAANVSMAAALRRALSNGELSLHYQPIYRLPSRELIGLEALARWRRDDGEMVGPDEFIPVAETTGLIHALGDWVLGTLCAQAAEWQALGLRPNFGINVSPRQLERPGFVADFAAVVARAGLNPRRLIVELTESAWSVEASRTLRALEALTHAGFSLALDDFGAGYSSLSRLHSLPVKVIKIDRSFLVDLPADPQACAIVEAILALAIACRCDVVCEGVETEAQLDFLSTRGCRLAQGFGLGRPAPAKATTELLLAELAPERRAAIT